MKKNKLSIRSLFLNRGIVSLIIFLVFTISGISQNVGISPTGAIPPDPAAALDVNFTTKGMLISRVVLINSTSPAPFTTHVAGMMVYNTATAGDVTPGLYFNDGTKWVSTLPTVGTAIGNMQYWNGTAWVIIPTGLSGQKLVINSSGVPAWSN